MSTIQRIIIIVVVAIATMITRFLPFIAFPANKETPKYIKYLGKVLPAAVLGLLVVYSLKDVSVFNDNHAIPEAICIAVTVFLHFWKRQMILSISAGMILYMVLVQSVFK